MEVQLSRPREMRLFDLHWRGIAAALTAAVVLVGVSGLVGRQILDARVAKPLPGAVKVHAQPLPTTAPAVGAGTQATPVALPDHMLLQVPFTTQAPLNNWGQHQESCEAANLTMLYYYWTNHSDVVIDPHAADNLINQIDQWKPQPDLNDTMLGQLAEQHLGYSYRILPNDPQVIAQQLSAGRPLLAEVRTHGLGNPHYPGYSSHFEQTGWSVPHFVTIIGYDSSGVWLNDPGISWGRGYHISYAQLAHAIDDLDQHHPNLSQGQVLLLIAPEAKPKVRIGSF
ncbi:MAG TPA: C39 family peptidase [Candidatus Dormibacteraeota bacterium]|nr:C39 family peptidase [Candidatus Dormibacteraeota bacterium]